jgi:hypothetical protein
MPKRVLDPDAASDVQPGEITELGPLRVKVHGSYRSVREPAWGMNFGPQSDVDQAIPGSGGATLRQLKEAGEIAADCFEAGPVSQDEPVSFHEE